MKIYMVQTLALVRVESMYKKNYHQQKVEVSRGILM